MRFQVGRRTAAAVVVCALGLSPTLQAAGDAAQAAAPAQAPAANEQAGQQKKLGTYRIIAGIAAIGLGGYLFSISRAQEGDIAGILPGQRLEGHEPSSRGKIAATGAIAAGTLLIYRGAKNRSAASKHPSIGVSVGKRTTVFLTRQW